MPLLLLIGIPEFVAMLGLFSRICLGIVGLTTLWSSVALMRLIWRARLHATTSATVFSRAATHFYGAYYLCEVLSVACLADQLFGFIHTWMDRATDANPYPVLMEAWSVSRVLFLFLVLTHAIRWYVAKLASQETAASA